MLMHHFVICGCPLCNIFPPYLINVRPSKKSYWTQNVWFDSPYNFVWNISHSKTNGGRYGQKYMLIFTICAVSLVIFEWNLKFLSRFFEKHANIKFHENPCNGSRVVPVGRTDGWTDIQTDTQTDRHDVANSLCSQFFVNSPENWTTKQMVYDAGSHKNWIPWYL